MCVCVCVCVCVCTYYIRPYKKTRTVQATFKSTSIICHSNQPSTGHGFFDIVHICIITEIRTVLGGSRHKRRDVPGPSFAYRRSVYARRCRTDVDVCAQTQ